jgi:hypothetical protein
MINEHVVAARTDGHFITDFYTLTIHRSHRTVRWGATKGSYKGL